MTNPNDPWDEVAAQPAASAALRAALASDEVGHAWVLVGPKGVGQQELARALGSALNCPTPVAADVGCGVCPVCARIRRGKHSAVLDLEPEGAAHLVDTVREWIRTASLTMSEGRRRVLRVVAADRMNEAAQNAFLKILEESPPSVIWLLDVQEEGALLETVLSRCRRLDLVPFGPEAMQHRAAQLGIPEDRREALVRAALGLPQRLKDLADPQVADARGRHLAVLDRLATGGPSQVVPLAKELVAWAKSRSAVLQATHKQEFAELEDSFGADGPRGWPPGIKAAVTRKHERLERQEQRRALDLVLDDLGSYLRDILAVQAGADRDGIVNIDHEEALRRDAVRLPAAAAVRGVSAVSVCRDALDRNGAPELQVERLLLALALPIYATAAAV